MPFMYLQETKKKTYAVKLLGINCTIHTSSRLDEYLGNNNVQASPSTVISLHEYDHMTVFKCIHSIRSLSE